MTKMTTLQKKLAIWEKKRRIRHFAGLVLCWVSARRFNLTL